MKNKKGVSAIVATALILLITVAAVTVVWAVVIPMITENMGEAEACLKAADFLEIRTDMGKTCTNTVNTSVQIRRTGDASVNIDHIQVLLIGEDGNSVTKILNSTSTPALMDIGEVKTYTFTNPSISTVEAIVSIKAENGKIYTCNDAKFTAKTITC